MKNKYRNLTQPLSLGAHRLSNRIVSSAHGEHMGHKGRIPQELIDYHTRRAQGGVGMIVAFGSGTIHPKADNAGNISLWDSENEPALREMAGKIRGYGTVLLAQATHRGPRESPTSLDAFTSAPSPMVGPFAHGNPHVLEVHEIEELVDFYAAAAARLARCGFSGIEITGLGSHLPELFWSPQLNQRTDKYGGSFTNRMRFSREIIHAVAQAVPEEFLVSFRISLDPQSHTLGLQTEDLLEIVDHLDALGRIDTISISGGSGATIETHAGNVPTEAYPLATYAHLAGLVKQQTTTPVAVAGRMLTAAVAEETIRSGQADMVAMTRALIADPDLPRHILRGTEEMARPCIAINEGCRRVTYGGRVTCTVNPVVADPALEHPVPATTSQRVAVVGGGPGGMEAARVAAQRGHAVTLFEKQPVLGGQVITAAKENGRPNLTRHVRWLSERLEELGVDVRLNTCATSGSLVESSFDSVILASGVKITTPAELRHSSAVVAVTDVDLLTETAAPPGEKDITVVDAQSYRRGAAIAATLAEDLPNRVRLATPSLEPMARLENSNKPPLLRRLTAAGVELLTSYELEFSPEAQLRHMWSDTKYPLGANDYLVAVGWTAPQSSLYAELRQAAAELQVQVIGDALAPRLMRNAISEGARSAVLI
ncbi:oxidoreductase [Nesterenkonia ebinurensis]|uniref:oxidoreductase n=1 Tax=Nesterenkonia ebinurensis TaxID=2608252 RepID=UPI00123CDFD0|nr:FAD-dependent oxidoreductase [Nesterenkonia ebinurensis]